MPATSASPVEKLQSFIKQQEPQTLYLIVGTVTALLLGTLVTVFVSTSKRKTSKGGDGDAMGQSCSTSEQTSFLTKSRQQVKLKEIIKLSHDTRLYRYDLGSGKKLGLPTGKHIKIYGPNPNKDNATWNNVEDYEAGKEEIERKYTPTSSDHDVGHFDLVVKVYTKGTHEKFPHGGKISQYLETIQVGDTIDISGPWGIIEYVGKGQLKKSSKTLNVKSIGMIAGGTGITPMLQVIEAVLRDPSDTTSISLLFGNQTIEDILLKDRLDHLAKKHAKRFKVHYTIDRPPPSGWTGSVGFVTKEMIEAHLPAPGPETVVLMCGPPPMVKFAARANLDALGYDKDAQLEF